MAAQGSPCGQGGLLASREVDIPHPATHCTHTHTHVQKQMQKHTHILQAPCCCIPAAAPLLTTRACQAGTHRPHRPWGDSAVLTYFMSEGTLDDAGLSASREPILHPTSLLRQIY